MSTELGKQAEKLARELFFAKKQATREQLILEAFSQVREQSKWVSVAEREPEYGSVSLVYCYDKRDEPCLPYQDLAGYSYHGGWGFNDANPEARVVVTHWQPLPPPPETTEQEE